MTMPWFADSVTTLPHNEKQILYTMGSCQGELIFGLPLVNKMFYLV